jgi:hypothetical protein
LCWLKDIPIGGLHDGVILLPRPECFAYCDYYYYWNDFYCDILELVFGQFYMQFVNISMQAFQNYFISRNVWRKHFTQKGKLEHTKKCPIQMSNLLIVCLLTLQPHWLRIWPTRHTGLIQRQPLVLRFYVLIREDVRV